VSQLYALRSRITHGALLLRSDEPLLGDWLHPREAEQQDQHEAARTLARIAVVNWLSAR